MVSLHSVDMNVAKELRYRRPFSAGASSSDESSLDMKNPDMVFVDCLLRDDGESFVITSARRETPFTRLSLSSEVKDSPNTLIRASRVVDPF